MKALISYLKPNNSAIYKKWLNYHQPNLAKYMLGFGIIFSLVLIPFDFLLFEEGGGFPPYRVALIALLSLGIVPMVVFSKLEKKDWINFSSSFSMILVGVGYNWVYQFFLFKVATPDNQTIVLVGNYMVIFFTTFIGHRMRFQQTTMSLLSMASLTYLIVTSPLHKSDGILLMICHISSNIVAIYFRHEFIKSINEKFDLLLAFMPKVLAEYIVIFNDYERINTLFKARNRYTVCLCSDWRNYQQITQEYSAEQISLITEDFYNRVFATLEEVDPTGQYHANWTADELFIIFYDEKDSEIEVNKKSLMFAKKLATELFLDVRFDTQLNLKYDIGLASGVGYLGLQGPKRFKKTTITGQSAGEAKRLETEAKGLRKKGTKTNPNPILLLDHKLYWHLREHNILSPAEFDQITAETKDIEGKTFYSYQADFFDVQILRELG